MKYSIMYDLFIGTIGNVYMVIILSDFVITDWTFGRLVIIQILMHDVCMSGAEEHSQWLYVFVSDFSIKKGILSGRSQ